MKYRELHKIFGESYSEVKRTKKHQEKKPLAVCIVVA